MNNYVFDLFVGPCLDCIGIDPCDNLSCANGFEDFDATGLGGTSSMTLNNALGGLWVYDGPNHQNTPDVCQETGGNKFIQIGILQWEPEGVAIRLQEPIEPGCKAVISFKASASAVSALDIFGSENHPCHPSESLINIGCIPTDCGGEIYDPKCIATVPITILHPHNLVPTIQIFIQVRTHRRSSASPR